MPRVAPNVPADTDLLCEYCGYTLNGLPPDANCPECGKPVELSLSPTRRHPPAWESSGRFWATTAAVIFRPTRFFRSFATRGNVKSAARFGNIHTLIASTLFAIATTIHADWFVAFGFGQSMTIGGSISIFVGMLMLIMSFLTLTTKLAAVLTNWEATYRGLRLTTPVVTRGLAYHAAHYLPVAIVALATVVGYQVLLRQHYLYWTEHATAYLYTLCGEVIVAAGYLFNTYWIGMRNMMYANH